MKRIIVLGSALVLAFAMNLCVFAANSPTAGGTTGSGSITTDDVVNGGSGSVTTEDIVNKPTAAPAAPAAPAATPAPAPTADPGLATGTQQFSEATLEEFATTTVILTSNGTAEAVSVDVAKAAIVQAKAVAGNDAFVAAIFDLKVPAGTGKATFKVACPNVWAGQSVKILHQKADGTWEVIIPDAVENNAVTFTMTSYSPVAIVVDVEAAPKTADPVMGVAAMAIISLAGAFVARKKED